MAFSFSNIETIRAFDNMEVLHTRFKDRRFPLHFHDTFVVQLIISGADNCSGTGLRARPQQVFVHTPHAAHAGGPLPGEMLEYRAIYPSGKTAEQLLGTVPDIPSVSFVTGCDRLIADMNRFFQTSETTERQNSLAAIIGRVCDLATGRNLHPDHESCGATSPSENRLAIAREYLIRNCQRDVSTEELSRVSLLSRFHLIREFKRNFGITPRQFLISQRVLLAKKLIADGEAIASVALKAGFSDQSHLNRCFKRVSGFNPGQYAKG